LRELTSNRDNGLLPADARELSRTFRPAALHRVLQAPRMVNAVEVARHLLAEEPLREWVVAVAAQPHGVAVLHGHDHAARIGTVVRADGTHGLQLRQRHKDSGSG